MPNKISDALTRIWVAPLVREIVNPLLLLLTAAAFVYFLWSIFQFIRNAGDADKRAEGQRSIAYGFVGLVIMFGAYGLINIPLTAFNLPAIHKFSTSQSPVVAVGGTGTTPLTGTSAQQTSSNSTDTSGPSATPVTPVSPWPVTDVTGMYDVAVAANTSLASASAAVTKAGGTVLVTLTNLHALVVHLTDAQKVVLAKNASILAIDQSSPIVAQQQTQSLFCLYAGTAPGAPTGDASKPAKPIKVAVVDYGVHGQLVMQAFQQQCVALLGASQCQNNISASMYEIAGAVPQGDNYVILDNTTRAEAITAAINDGANVINISSGGFTMINRFEQAALNLAASKGVVIVVSAGNSPDAVNSLSLPNPSGATVISVGGVDPWYPGKPDSRYAQNADIFANDFSGSAQNSDPNGTSIAAPRITAAIAANMAVTGVTDPVRAKAQLLSSCQQDPGGTNKSTPGGTIVPARSQTSEDPYLNPNSSNSSGNDQYKSQNRTQTSNVDTIDILPDGTRVVTPGAPQGFQRGITDDRGVVPSGDQQSSKDPSGKVDTIEPPNGQNGFAADYSDLVSQINDLRSGVGQTWTGWSTAVGGWMGNLGGYMMSGLIWMDLGGFMSQTQAPKGY